MKKISVKDLLDFRGKSAKAKKTFVEKIKSNKIEKPSTNGGNYWASTLSAASKSYKEEDLAKLEEKVDELHEKLASTEIARTKNMYQENINVLKKYQGVDLKAIRPQGKLPFLKKSTANQLLNIKGLQIKTDPSYVFTFKKEEQEKIGAVWFVIKKGGYKNDEIGLFCDLLYRFLKHNYSRKYQLAAEFCMAVDIFNRQAISYFEIENGQIPTILTNTLDEINKLM